MNASPSILTLKNPLSSVECRSGKSYTWRHSLETGYDCNGSSTRHYRECLENRTRNGSFFHCVSKVAPQERTGAYLSNITFGIHKDLATMTLTLAVSGREATGMAWSTATHPEMAYARRISTGKPSFASAPTGGKVDLPFRNFQMPQSRMYRLLQQSHRREHSSPRSLHPAPYQLPAQQLAAALVDPTLHPIEKRVLQLRRRP